MNPRVNKVRKSISARKKSRGVTNSDSNKNSFSQFQIQEEEKHGYFPIFTDSSSSANLKNKMVAGFILKGILSSILFLGAALLFQANNEILDKPKTIASSLLTNEFPFAKVNQWYQQSFGAPLALTPKSNTEVPETSSLALPVSGDITQSFQTNGEGVLIAPDETSSITALNEGIIIFAGNDPETNKTIVIQHADGSTSTYGFLSSINVHLYEFVEGNQVIARFEPSENNKNVYFAIEKNDEFVDPVEVIEVDDIP